MRFNLRKKLSGYAEFKLKHQEAVEVLHETAISSIIMAQLLSLVIFAYCLMSYRPR